MDVKSGFATRRVREAPDRGEIPWTWSPCARTRDRIVVDPRGIGVDGIPVLGTNRARDMSDGAEFHRHAAMEITVCERGAVKFDADGRAWTLLPGTVFVTQPGDVHRLRSNVRGSVLRWIFATPPEPGGSFLGLAPEDSAALAARLASLDKRLYRLQWKDARLAEALMDDYERSGGPGDMRLLRFRADALRFLFSVIDAAPVKEDPPPASRIFPVIARMRREPEKNYPVIDLVAETRMSETSLATAFKRETGCAPHEFLVVCRIRKAMDVLAKDPSARITDLALELGFSSSQHFAARFRRETGKTPSEWRERGRG